MNKEIDLSKLIVQVVVDYDEMNRVESLMSRQHPLGARKAQGRRLTYRVSYRGEWVAIGLFDQSVFRNKWREEKIGWSDTQRQHRLQHIAGNSRYLVLREYQGVPNIASKCLSLMTGRISQDWYRRYGIPLVALETYVDPEHNKNEGTCYTAAGWEKLGLSSGFEQANGERTHGKWYFLKALHEDSYAALRAEIPHALLSGVKPVTGKSNNNYVLDASKFNMKELQKALEKVPDPRKKSGLIYKFIPLLSMCIAAVVSGYTQYRQIADWIKHIPAADRARFGMPGDRSPHESQVGRLLANIDTVALQTALNNWVLETYHKDTSNTTITLDGKALRGTSDQAHKQHAFLNVYANDLGIVIQQLPTSKGAGEKAATHLFLEAQGDMTGITVLADAMHTDKEIVNTLVKKKPRMSSLLRTIKSL
jgi:hypothetical protein